MAGLPLLTLFRGSVGGGGGGGEVARLTQNNVALGKVYFFFLHSERV